MSTPDFGPVYAETNWDAFIKEPFNALTASVFIVLALVWLVRLHPVRTQYRVLYASMWLLLVGGIGGTLYHAFRAHWVFLLLDTLPIVLLGLSTTVYVVRRLTRDWFWVFAPICAVAGLWIAVAYLVPGTLSITLRYALIGLVLSAPLVILSIRAGYGLWDRILPAQALFAVALGCRAVDLEAGRELGSGTHGFWHLLAAVALALVIRFLWEARDFQAEGVPSRAVGLGAAGE